MPSFYEFFAGGGMARAGLGSNWTCLFANDFDEKKAASYGRNWGDSHLKVGDVAQVKPAELPMGGDMAWASFPCQDLSLAGAGAGLKGSRSGTFWPFWNLIKSLVKEGRGPRLVVLENVYGALTSHAGKDFAAIGAALSDAGYRFGAVVVDAAAFVPQSRPRLFVVGFRDDRPIPQALISSEPNPRWHPATLVEAHAKLSKASRDAWVWWSLPAPPVRASTFADVVEENPIGVKWHTQAQTRQLLAMMNPLHLAKVEAAKASGRRMVGAIYKRTRTDGPNGEKMQRAEIRFDDMAGCLRTPAGGSSRQLILIVEGKRIRSRLLSPREAARLMGLPDSYELPTNYNEAYHLAGDGVAVPVVRYLAAHILEPLLESVRSIGKKAA